MASARGKRHATGVQGPSKKRKITHAKFSNPQKPTTKYPIKRKEDRKQKLADRGFIPIPAESDNEGAELSEQDLEMFDEYGGAVSFLDKLDRKGISMSKKETERLHQMNKPVPRASANDSLPSVDSHDEGSWSSGFDEDEPISASDLDEEGPSIPSSRISSVSWDSNEEMPYEVIPRKRLVSPSREDRGVERLPIKLENGRIEKIGRKDVTFSEEDTTTDVEDEEPYQESPRPMIEDVSTGARFGRPAVVDIIGNPSRTARIHAAKEQIADICQEILAEPENSLGLLRRLHTFSLLQISTPTHLNPVPNDPLIRKLAMLSQLAVFKDIIPGYRVRALTDKEKSEKVSQQVARTREWEQGLVSIYQSYLRSLDAELKSRSDLATTALRCMCMLLAEATHFNFRVNLMTCIVARLSKRSWDEVSDLCLESLITVFRQDNTGQASLEGVRLLNRMIKERRYNIHPDVLSCLLHLRLKTELGVRASDSTADKRDTRKALSKRAKGKSKEQPHLSKMARKALKERKEIEREFREAEAEVDREERAVTQTETLKLLFVLYFQILKHPGPTPLLPAALQGISKFAHLVNIDFFRDLLRVLKELMSRNIEEDIDDMGASTNPANVSDIQHRLLCIVTAFELLSGQGESLNIDLSDFISGLYVIILSLSIMPQLDQPPSTVITSELRSSRTQTTADMLFRALNLVFFSRSHGANTPPWRSAAFAKRLLIVSLHWPGDLALRALEFVENLIAKDPKLEALLSTDDRISDGIYRPDVNDPQLCNPFGTSFWELHLLHQHHVDVRVREEASKLVKFTRS